MPHGPRLDIPGALHHVVVRGIDRQNIFLSDADRNDLLCRLGEGALRSGLRVYAWALMSNHLLVETGRVALSKIMQGLQQSYALYFNREYGLVGHLFQGRYKAIVCDRDSYLLELVRYIHLNPIRSKMVKDPAAYRWSSHRAYLGKTAEQEGNVGTHWVLSQFSRNRSEALRQYRQFVWEGIPVKCPTLTPP